MAQKVNLYRDERYPDYGIITGSTSIGSAMSGADNLLTEVPDELVERYLKANAEYNEVQELLSEVWKKQHPSFPLKGLVSDGPQS